MLEKDLFIEPDKRESNLMYSFPITFPPPMTSLLQFTGREDSLLFRRLMRREKNREGELWYILLNRESSQSGPHCSNLEYIDV